MTDEVSIIPTLDGGPDEIIRTPEYNLAYLVRHFLYAPGSTSSIYESELLSFRKLEATHRHDRSALLAAAQRTLADAVERRYGTKYQVLVASYLSTETSYGIHIDIQDRATGISAIPKTAFILKDNVLSLDYSYKG